MHSAERPPGLSVLLEGLRTLLAEKGLSLRTASLALGRAPNHLGRSLAGRRRLSVLELFRLLAQLEVKPEEVFAICFPFGQAASPEGVPLLPERRLPSWWTELVEPLAERQRQQSLASVWTPEEWAEQLASSLRHLAQRHRGSLAAAARRWGFPKDRLGRSLRGLHSLSCEEVFAVLAQVGVSPGRFLFELALPEAGLADRLARKRLLDQAEELLRNAEAGVERAGKGRAGGKNGAPASGES